MSTAGLKERLIGRIREIEDEDILAEAYRLLGAESDMDELQVLTTEQKAAVEEARSQIRNGVFLTNEQADDEIDEWLKR
nr:hypothetical protein [uncultured Dyadobacter sp.]